MSKTGSALQIPSDNRTTLNANPIELWRVSVYIAYKSHVLFNVKYLVSNVLFAISDLLDAMFELCECEKSLNGFNGIELYFESIPL